MLPVQQWKNNDLGMANYYNPYAFKYKDKKKSKEQKDLEKWGSTSWQQTGLARLFAEQQQQRK